ncbi:MAG: pseudouridine synthase, partial [Aquificota bacterium]
MKGVRLSKYLVDCGVATRRQAKKLIRQGRVKVNGQVVKDPDYRVFGDKDLVEYMGQVVAPIKGFYIAFYKPAGYL